MAVTPCSNVRLTVSANDLKPDSSSRVSFIESYLSGVSCGVTTNDGMPIFLPASSACSRVA